MIDPKIIQQSADKVEAIMIKLRESLAKADFISFFELISQIDSFARYNLTLQALEIAKQQKNSWLITQFIEIDIYQWHIESLFSQLLQALVELDALDAAFGLIIRNENKKLEAGEGWYLLAKILSNAVNLSEVKQIFPYIKQPRHQEEIIKLCFNRIILPTQLLTWLEWFELCSPIKSDVSLDFKEVIAALAVAPGFEPICDRLKKIKDSKLKQQLIRQLYFYLFTNQKFDKTTKLNTILPTEINWLVKLGNLLGDKPEFKIFANLKIDEAQLLIDSALEALVQREQFNNDANLAKIIVDAAVQAEIYEEKFIEVACNICLKCGRIDAVLALMPSLKYNKTHLMEDLVGHELSDSQYQAILQQMNTLEVPLHYSYISNEENILKKIPKDLIDKEYTRRAQNFISISQTKFAKETNIHSKQVIWQEINEVINQLLRYKQFNAVFELCKKLVASKVRDSYLLQCLHYALALPDFTKATSIAKLFAKPADQQSLSQFLSYYRTFNYRKAFLVLMKRNNQFEFSTLLLDCVNNILAENNKAEAASFLVKNAIFELYGDYSDNDNGTIIKRKVVVAIVETNKNNKKFLKILTSFKKNNITNFEVYFLKELLESKRFEAAILLINACLKKDFFGKLELPEELEELSEKITEYIEKLIPDVACLDTLAVLEDQFLQARLIRQLLKDITKQLSPASIEIINAIPIQELKVEYLVHAIICCIEENRLALARKTLAYFPENIQAIWSQILTYAEQGCAVDILNLIIKREIEEIQLLDWAVGCWLVNKNPDYLFENLLKFCQIFSGLDLEKHFNVSLEKIYTLSANRKIYEALIWPTFSHWQQLLVKAKDYLSYRKGIVLLLPHSETQERFSAALLDTTKSMVKDQNYNETFAALKLLIQHKKNFLHYYFKDFVVLILDQGALDFADKLLTLVQDEQGSWLEQSLIKITDIYFSQENYKKIILLLKPQQQSYAILQYIKDRCIELIKNDKEKNAIELVDTLLEKAGEECFINIVESLLVNKKELVSILNYIETKIATPGTKLRLKQGLKTVYLEKLEAWIGKDAVAELNRAQKSLTTFLKAVKAAKLDPKEIVLANQDKNTIITELRSQLDKAFLEFYRKNCVQPPVPVRSNFLNVFFPVVPSLDGKTIEERLLVDYLKKKLKILDFDKKFPKLYEYIKSIQPLSNPNYIWLDQLYKLANRQKHANTLDLKTEVDAVAIDWAVFLPQVIDGVCEILLKLKFPQVDLTDLKKLCFSHFAPLMTYSTSVEFEKIGIFKISIVKAEESGELKEHGFVMNEP